MTRAESEHILNELLDELITIKELEDEYTKGYMEALKTAMVVVRSVSVSSH